MTRQQTFDSIPHWEDRLDYGRPQSPSNKERMAAMQAEIHELRSALLQQARQHDRLLKQANERNEHKLNTARGKVEFWRKVVYSQKAELAKAQRALSKAQAPRKTGVKSIPPEAATPAPTARPSRPATVWSALL